MSTKRRLLLSVGISLAWIWLVGFNWALAVIAVVVAAILIPAYLKIDSICAARDEAKRLAFDADYQHAAWNAGDDRTALFGRYQP